jgi:hypothetical protein
VSGSFGCSSSRSRAVLSSGSGWSSSKPRIPSLPPSHHFSPLQRLVRDEWKSYRMRRYFRSWVRTFRSSFTRSCSFASAHRTASNGRRRPLDGTGRRVQRRTGQQTNEHARQNRPSYLFTLRKSSVRQAVETSRPRPDHTLDNEHGCTGQSGDDETHRGSFSISRLFTSRRSEPSLLLHSSLSTFASHGILDNAATTPNPKSLPTWALSTLSVPSTISALSLSTTATSAESCHYSSVQDKHLAQLSDTLRSDLTLDVATSTRTPSNSASRFSTSSIRRTTQESGRSRATRTVNEDVTRRMKIASGCTTRWKKVTVVSTLRGQRHATFIAPTFTLDHSTSSTAGHSGCRVRLTLPFLSYEPSRPPFSPSPLCVLSTSPFVTSPSASSPSSIVRRSRFSSASRSTANCGGKRANSGRSCTRPCDDPSLGAPLCSIHFD